MDKILLIKLSLIGAIFLVFCFYIIINIIRLNHTLNVEDEHFEPKRKIIKRQNTNVYDLKASRRK